MIAQIETESTLELKIEIESDSGEALVDGGMPCCFVVLVSSRTKWPFVPTFSFQITSAGEGWEELQIWKCETYTQSGL